MRRWLRIGLVLASTVACSRKENASTTDAEAPSTTPVAPSALATPAPPQRVQLVPAEARRSKITRFEDEHALAQSGDVLGKHFGAQKSFDVQSVDLGLGGRHAELVSITGLVPADAKPIVLVTDERGAPVWNHARPVAGILPPVSAYAIAAGPRGRVALAACDPPTKAVALRLWDDDGSPFADFSVLDFEACADVSLFYWPKKGWIVTAVGVGATRARFVSEAGSPEWGTGLELGVRSREGAIAPAAIADDTDETFVLVQPGKADDGSVHAYAFRYDMRGSAIWPAAKDLGPSPQERLEVFHQSPAGVRVSFGKSEVDVKPSGDVVRRDKRAP